MFIGTMVQIVGAVVLVSVIQPWFLLAVVIVLLAYYWIAIYYRASAREVKVNMFCLVLSSRYILIRLGIASVSMQS
jgi:ABC-type multidrug transport system permease subunit